ncbi:MAG: glycine cleavage system aminomethyltransferase GcvT [Alphaproteobacteria bacterium]
MSELKKTPLYELHLELGAKMVEFTGYSMPVQYSLGVIKEHNHTRQKAGLFDVSHMGQAWLIGESQSKVANQLEKLLPAEIEGLASGKQQYSQLLNENGGVLDDLIVTKPAEERYNDRLYMVVNAGCKDADYALMSEKLNGVKILRLEDRAQIALQGPKAVDCLAKIVSGAENMKFMTFKCFSYNEHELLISRSGYTGEDGYEISIPENIAIEFTKKLLEMEDVEPIGLGARDSLRLEAGLCLYGNDLNETISPIDAGLLWSIGKRRRAEGGFTGSETILKQIKSGVNKKRVGLNIEGKMPCRAGTEIFVGDKKVGIITSGGFGPTVNRPVAMAYIDKEFSAIDTDVVLKVRNKEIIAKICKMPFSKKTYVR